jgi:hypothetical protein
VAEQPLDLERSAGETDREYLDRLTGLDTAGWSVDDRMTLALLIRDAQRAVAARAHSDLNSPRQSAALRLVKRLVRQLPEQERRELARWIAEGCQGDRAPRGRGGRLARDRRPEAAPEPLSRGRFADASDRRRR